MTNAKLYCNFADRDFPTHCVTPLTFAAMKIETTLDEWMRMQNALVEAKVENALLRKELVQAAAERDTFRARLIAAHLEEVMQQRDLGKVVPILLSKMPVVLSELENMDQVRLVLCVILKMLPDNVPAELVKMVTDAAPGKVQADPLVQIEMEKGGDIIGQGGTKNINHYGQEPEKGEKAV